MIKFQDEVGLKIEEKSLIQIAPKDVLKRKQDCCYYEVKDITYSILENTATYHFFGFSIRGQMNLKYHFENEYNMFAIYGSK